MPPTRCTLPAAASLALALLAAPAVLAGPVGAPEPELRARLVEATRGAAGFADRFEALVWLADYSSRIARYMPDERQRLDFLRQVHAEARRARLEPELVLAVIHIESRFDRYALSHAGAVGYMQIMPFWLKELGQDEGRLFAAETNLRMGCTILRYYLDKERGDVFRALARYNGSLGRSEYPDAVLGVQRERYEPF
jgi:soluble lytic murein transglycosylase-like protein